MIDNITSDGEFGQIIQGSWTRQIYEIDTWLSYGHVIVYGGWGSGKTTLLNRFAKLNTKGFERIDFWRGYEVEMDDSLLSPYLIASASNRVNEGGELLIIDGFDEIQSPVIKEKLAIIMREGRKLGHRVLLSSRVQINEKIFDHSAHVLFIDGLKPVDISKIVNIYVRHAGDRPDIIQKVSELIGGFKGNPGEIIMALNFLLPQTQLGNKGLIYRNPVIIEELEKPTIILEEAPKMITDIRLVNKRILDKISRKPHEIYQLNPRQFEMLVAELFEERGYKVELTQQTRDGGKDLIILDHREIGNLMIYAECKQYAPDRPVGVSVVSDLVGRMTADRATAGIIVTSSYFSPDAKNFQSKFEHQISLIDFVKLSAMINDDPTGKIITHS